MERMLRLVPLSDVPLSVATNAWNEGFSDYYVSIPMSPRAFASVKFGSEDVHPDRSFVAFAADREEPIGLLLNAIRSDGDGTIAWNAGTAVHPDERGTGVGPALLRKAIETYREAGVRTAYLEAFEQNERAIRLYRGFGYEPFDTLHGLEAADGLDFGPPADDPALRLSLRPPSVLEELRFAAEPPAWQTRWQSAKSGEALVASLSGVSAGYALFRRAASATTLLQYAVDPRLPEETARSVARELLRGVFAGADPESRRRVFAAPASQPFVHDVLAAAGFKESYRLTHMRLRLE